MTNKTSKLGVDFELETTPRFAKMMQSKREREARQMTTETKKTTKQYIEELAISNTSNERDNKIMQAILRRLNFPMAVVTCGIVYLEGQGTLDAPPMLIHSIAKMILDIDKKNKGGQ